MKKINSNNISTVVKDNLCIGCGACQGICPFNAVKMEWGDEQPLPIINDNCRFCCLCILACPGFEIDFDKLNNEFFGKIPKDIRIGNYLEIWAGHTSNNSLRYKAASGGLVSSLLVHALEEKIIDGAVVLGFDPKNPLLPKAVIVKSKKDLITSCGSNYLSGSICSVIPEILKFKGKIAVVGQPCHLAAFRKAELYLKALRKKIVLHFGLFCQTKTTLMGLEFWLKMNNINKQDLSKLSYRGNGWPGGMLIKLKSNKQYFYPLPSYWQFLEKFSPLRCTLCSDSLAEFSDISFGDAWVSEYEKDNKGTSIIIIRSPSGKKLFDSAIKKGKVIGQNVPLEMLIRSQKVSLTFKKEEFYYRQRLLRFLKIKTPYFKGGYLNKAQGSYFGAVKFYLTRWLYEIKLVWPLLYQWKLKLHPLIKKNIKKIQTYLVWVISKMINPFINILINLITFLFLHMIFGKKQRTKSPKRVLIINQADLLNKGDQALLTATEEIIRKSYPQADVVVATHTLDIDKPRHVIPMVPSYRFLSAENNVLKLLRTIYLFIIVVFYRFYILINNTNKTIFNSINKTLFAYIQADLVIHRGGDNLTEDYGIPYIYFESILISLLFQKPTVVLGESIGPFKNKKSKKIASQILNETDLIIAREDLSLDTLKKLKITKPKITVLPDVAFLLKPSGKDKLSSLLYKEGLKSLTKPVIPISVSALLAQYAFPEVSKKDKIDQLVLAMVKLIKHIRNKYHATIIFVPHVIGKDNDDRIISRQIASKLGNYNNIYVINGEYSHEDFKALFTKYADLFIGARMHANIAALTSKVPTLALSYGQKTQGIIGKMLGLSDYILDVRQIKDGNILGKQMIAKIDLIWDKQNDIRKVLTKKIPDCQCQTLKYVKLLKTFSYV